MRAFSDKLVGRDEALGALVRSVCAHRLVTLYGPAGGGKSALAHAAAHRLAEAGAFPAGVFWVSLRGVRHADIAQEAVVRQVPSSAEAALVILDSLEWPALVTPLLARFPTLHLLTTAHAPLGLPHEQALELPLLHVSEARRLLVGWSRKELDPEEAASVARFLDGNPQAVRLVAALLETEPLTALRVRLETQLTALTLHGGTATPLTIARDLLLERLPEGVGRLLGVLSLFATGARAEDIEVSWGKGWQRSMDVLVRAGLVAEDEGRYQVVIALPEAPPQAQLGPTGVLLALALGHLRLHEPEPAFDLAERALAVAREGQNREGFASALLVLGRITLTDDPARAVLLFEEAAAHFENLGQRASQAEARRWQGVAFAQLGEPEAALSALYDVQQAQHDPATERLFAELQTLLTDRGGGSLLAALAMDTTSIRETGLLAARVRLGLPGK
ncbi:AAA family ATPase [Armatimonas rosea]|uniref:Tetratricopeptide (TPR) repeat protein n=1 Tax=Armatimonas rosea TaxID=685828 RepID=A0A7W9SL02_ARMRO|nr:AAA family ATPase [Armatimonas rosea]MBB6048577.1 tetratricopeptide (TPR) repeat protein [Armatimonas rosea]